MQSKKSPKSAHFIGRKIVAIFLSISFVLYESLCYAAPAFRGNANSLLEPNPLVAIPASLGQVEFVQKGVSPKTLIYIQDAHDSLEAQENIAAMITHLVQREGVRTVFEEGYEGELATQKYFENIPDAEIRRKVAYFLMDHLRISGAEYAHLTANDAWSREHGAREKPHSPSATPHADFQLIGADNLVLHRSNLKHYQKARKVQAAVEKDLIEIESGLNHLTNQKFSPELKAILKLRDRFEKNQITLPEYWRRLSTGESQISLERAVSGKSLAEFFTLLHDLENQALRRGLKTAEERELFDDLEAIRVFKKLPKMQASSSEFDQALSHLKTFRTDKLAQFLARESLKPIALSKDWEEGIHRAVQFYQTAIQRDQGIGSALDQFLNNPRETKAVLVFGGFHRNNILEILQKKGFSYQSVIPVMTQHSARHQRFYQNLMMGKRFMFESDHQVENSKSESSQKRDFEILTKPSWSTNRTPSYFELADLNPGLASRESSLLGNVASQVREPAGVLLIRGMEIGIRRQRMEAISALLKKGSSRITASSFAQRAELRNAPESESKLLPGLRRKLTEIQEEIEDHEWMLQEIERVLRSKNLIKKRWILLFAMLTLCLPWAFHFGIAPMPRIWMPVALNIFGVLGIHFIGKSFNAPMLRLIHARGEITQKITELSLKREQVSERILDITDPRRLQARLTMPEDRLIADTPVSDVSEEAKKTQYYHGVFKGGGTRLLAIVGVLEEAWRRGVRFASVAGTSGGALMAGMIAVGYHPTEIREVLFKSRFSLFQDSIWQQFRNFFHRGIHRTYKLDLWTREIIERKTGNAEVKLAELKTPFSSVITYRVPGSKTTNRFVLDRNTAPGLTLHQAITLSQTLTPFFVPTVVDAELLKLIPAIPLGSIIEDGIWSGAVGCGYPMFIYDDEKVRGEFPVLGFSTTNPKNVVDTSDSPLFEEAVYAFLVPLLKRVPGLSPMIRRFEDALDGHDQEIQKDRPWAQFINVYVEAGALQLGMHLFQKIRLIKSGRDVMRRSSLRPGIPEEEFKKRRSEVREGKGLLPLSAITADGHFETRHFSHVQRDSDWSDLASQPHVMHEIFILGGGGVGAATAREAALSGKSVVLAEAAAIGGETSGKSTKIIHAGFRYEELAWVDLTKAGKSLLHFQFADVALHLGSFVENIKLLIGGSREKGNLVRMTAASSSVVPLRYTFPVYEGDEYGPFMIWCGAMIYSLIAKWMGAQGSDFEMDWSGRDILKRFRMLKPSGLRGGVRYWDARADDDRLLTLQLAREAYDDGAKILSYVRVVDYEKVPASPNHASHFRIRIRNELDPDKKEITVLAKELVVAAGPAIDQIRKDLQGNKEPLMELSRGTHIDVTNPLWHRQIEKQFPEALYFVYQKRKYFAIPRHDNGLWYLRIGTTDEKAADALDRYPKAKEIQDIVNAFNSIVQDPLWKISPHDIVAADAAIRPLQKSKLRQGSNLVSTTRMFQIVEGEQGEIFPIGVKLTDVRWAAEKILAKIAKKQGEVHHSRSADIPLRHLAGEKLGRNPEISKDHFAGRMDAILNHAIDYEMLLTFKDYMLSGGIRELLEPADDNTRVVLSLEKTMQVLDMLGQKLGWDEGRKVSEFTAFDREWQKRMAAVREWESERHHTRAEFRQIDSAKRTISPVQLTLLIFAYSLVGAGFYYFNSVYYLPWSQKFFEDYLVLRVAVMSILGAFLGIPMGLMAEKVIKGKITSQPRDVAMRYIWSVPFAFSNAAIFTFFMFGWVIDLLPFTGPAASYLKALMIQGMVSPLAFDPMNFFTGRMINGRIQLAQMAAQMRAGSVRFSILAFMIWFPTHSIAFKFSDKAYMSLIQFSAGFIWGVLSFLATSSDILPKFERFRKFWLLQKLQMFNEVPWIAAYALSVSYLLQLGVIARSIYLLVPNGGISFLIFAVGAGFWKMSKKPHISSVASEIDQRSELRSKSGNGHQEGDYPQWLSALIDPTELGVEKKTIFEWLQEERNVAREKRIFILSLIQLIPRIHSVFDLAASWLVIQSATKLLQRDRRNVTTLKSFIAWLMATYPKDSVLELLRHLQANPGGIWYEFEEHEEKKSTQIPPATRAETFSDFPEPVRPQGSFPEDVFLDDPADSTGIPDGALEPVTSEILNPFWVWIQSQKNVESPDPEICTYWLEKLSAIIRQVLTSLGTVTNEQDHKTFRAIFQLLSQFPVLNDGGANVDAEVMELWTKLREGLARAQLAKNEDELDSDLQGLPREIRGLIQDNTQINSEFIVKMDRVVARGNQGLQPLKRFIQARSYALVSKERVSLILATVLRQFAEFFKKRRFPRNQMKGYDQVLELMDQLPWNEGAEASVRLAWQYVRTLRYQTARQIRSEFRSESTAAKINLFSQQFKRVRTERGLSRKQLAEKFQATRDPYFQGLKLESLVPKIKVWETGKTVPQMQLRPIIAKVLNAPDLFKGVPEPQRQRIVKISGLISAELKKRLVHWYFSGSGLQINDQFDFEIKPQGSLAFREGAQTARFHFLDWKAEPGKENQSIHGLAIFEQDPDQGEVLNFYRVDTFYSENPLNSQPKQTCFFQEPQGHAVSVDVITKVMTQVHGRKKIRDTKRLREIEFYTGPSGEAIADIRSGERRVRWIISKKDQPYPFAGEKGVIRIETQEGIQFNALYLRKDLENVDWDFSKVKPVAVDPHAKSLVFGQVQEKLVAKEKKSDVVRKKIVSRPKPKPKAVKKTEPSPQLKVEATLESVPAISASPLSPDQGIDEFIRETVEDNLKYHARWMARQGKGKVNQLKERLRPEFEHTVGSLVRNPAFARDLQNGRQKIKAAAGSAILDLVRRTETRSEIRSQSPEKELTKEKWDEAISKINPIRREKIQKSFLYKKLDADSAFNLAKRWFKFVGIDPLPFLAMADRDPEMLTMDPENLVRDFSEILGLDAEQLRYGLLHYHSSMLLKSPDILAKNHARLMRVVRQLNIPKEGQVDALMNLGLSQVSAEHIEALFNLACLNQIPIRHPAALYYALQKMRGLAQAQKLSSVGMLWRNDREAFNRLALEALRLHWNGQVNVQRALSTLSWIQMITPRSEIRARGFEEQVSVTEWRESFARVHDLFREDLRRRFQNRGMEDKEATQLASRWKAALGIEPIQFIAMVKINGAVLSFDPEELAKDVKEILGLDRDQLRYGLLNYPPALLLKDRMLLEQKHRLMMEVVHEMKTPRAKEVDALMDLGLGLVDPEKIKFIFHVAQAHHIAIHHPSKLYSALLRMHGLAAERDLMPVNRLWKLDRTNFERIALDALNKTREGSRKVQKYRTTIDVVHYLTKPRSETRSVWDEETFKEKAEAFIKVADGYDSRAELRNEFGDSAKSKFESEASKQRLALWTGLLQVPVKIDSVLDSAKVQKIVATLRATSQNRKHHLKNEHFRDLNIQRVWTALSLTPLHPEMQLVAIPYGQTNQALVILMQGQEIAAYGFYDFKPKSGFLWPSFRILNHSDQTISAKTIYEFFLSALYQKFYPMMFLVNASQVQKTKLDRKTKLKNMIFYLKRGFRPDRLPAEASSEIDAAFLQLVRGDRLSAVSAELLLHHLQTAHPDMFWSSPDLSKISFPRSLKKKRSEMRTTEWKELFDFAKKWSEEFPDETGVLKFAGNAMVKFTAIENAIRGNPKISSDAMDAYRKAAYEAIGQNAFPLQGDFGRAGKHLWVMRALGSLLVRKPVSLDSLQMAYQMTEPHLPEVPTLGREKISNAVRSENLRVLLSRIRFLEPWISQAQAQELGISRLESAVRYPRYKIPLRRDSNTRIPLCLFGKKTALWGDAILQWLLTEEFLAQYQEGYFDRSFPSPELQKLFRSEFLSRVLNQLSHGTRVEKFEGKDFGDTFESMIAMVYVANGGLEGKGLEKARHFIFSQFYDTLRVPKNQAGIDSGIIRFVNRAAEKLGIQPRNEIRKTSKKTKDFNEAGNLLDQENTLDSSRSHSRAELRTTPIQIQEDEFLPDLLSHSLSPIMNLVGNIMQAYGFDVQPYFISQKNQALLHGSAQIGMTMTVPITWAVWAGGKLILLSQMSLNHLMETQGRGGIALMDQEEWKRLQSMRREIISSRFLKPDGALLNEQDILLAMPSGYFKTQEAAFHLGLHHAVWTMLEMLEESKEKYRGKLVWDVGAGDGVLSGYLLKDARAVLLLDNNPLALKIARYVLNANGYREVTRLRDLANPQNHRVFYLAEASVTDAKTLKALIENAPPESMVMNWGNLTDQGMGSGVSDAQALGSILGLMKQLHQTLPSSIFNAGYSTGPTAKAPENLEPVQLFGRTFEDLQSLGYNLKPRVAANHTEEGVYLHGGISAFQDSASSRSDLMQIVTRTGDHQYIESTPRSELRFQTRDVGRENVGREIKPGVRRSHAPSPKQVLKSTVLVDYRDVSQNFSEMQIKELLFWIRKGGRGVRVLMTHVDSTEALGKFFLDEASKSQGRFKTQRIFTNAKGESSQPASFFDGTIIGLSSEKFHWDHSILRNISNQILFVKHHNSSAGSLGQALQDSAKLLRGKDWRPESFDQDATGRFFIREGYESVMRGWEIRINARIAFAFERAA